jgi:hypothetical protein
VSRPVRVQAAVLASACTSVQLSYFLKSVIIELLAGAVKWRRKKEV